MPEWLLRTSGRFVLVALIACLSLGYSQGYYALISKIIQDKFQPNIVLFTLAVLPFTIVRQSLGVAWAVFDDRRSEQPWFAVARGTCLVIFCQNIDYIVAGIQWTKRFPDMYSRFIAEKMGYAPSEIVITVIAGLVFLLLPSPKRRVA
ncbi:hypothetical protein BH11ARM2_BH11ARM2_08750 [soil metagenome]